MSSNGFVLVRQENQCWFNIMKFFVDKIDQMASSSSFDQKTTNTN